MGTLQKTFWVTWHRQRRNTGISQALDIPLVEILPLAQNRLVAYLEASWRTFRFLIEKKPLMLFAQNPSMMLGLLLILLKPFMGFKVVLDAHNAGIHPIEGRSTILNCIAAMLQRFADLTIVTNAGLAKIVTGNRGRPVILPDRIPDVPDADFLALTGRHNIFVISSFAPDEPYRSAIAAADLLPLDIHMYFSGKTDRIPSSVMKVATENVHFTGFVSDVNFWRYLRSCDIVMVLTRRENCLVCGAYEALAARKPLILSDKKALREYFRSGSFYSRNEPKEIADTIKHTLANPNQITGSLDKICKNIESRWEQRFLCLVAKVKMLTNDKPKL